jgi:16S rRNA (cytosine1402-N4)-methyltransferase
MLRSLRGGWQRPRGLRAYRRYSHVSVLLEETVAAWRGKHDGSETALYYVDCTLGGGGHTLHLLQAEPRAHVLGLDLDAEAIAHVRQRASELLGPADAQRRLLLQQGSYADIVAHMSTNKWPARVHGIVADLGVSSHQLDEGGRGFSLRRDGPLDMRFGPSNSNSGNNGITAADLVNKLPQAELARIFRVYGEERWASPIAAAVVKRRPLARTRELASVIADTVHAMTRNSGGSDEGGTHAATRCFQALRIAVNDELRTVEALLRTGPSLLAPRPGSGAAAAAGGGRMAVITFHSLEDRLVKTAFTQLVSSKSKSSGAGYVDVFGGKGMRGFAVASEAEVEANPRSRSAKLRAIERL